MAGLTLYVMWSKQKPDPVEVKFALQMAKLLSTYLF